MTPEDFYTRVLLRGLEKTARFAPHLGSNRSLDVLMTTIAGVESNWTDLVQIPGGQAHGLFQMQVNTIALLKTNPASADLFQAGMNDFGINTQTAEHLFEIIGTPEGMSLSVFLARLDLWCNPRPIPPWDEMGSLWAYYIDTWRPGKPDYPRWQRCYGQALQAINAA